MERKIGNDRRGEETLGRTSRKKVGGLVASVLVTLMALGCAVLPGKAEKDYAKLPSGKIVHFLKPTTSIKIPDSPDYEVYKLETKYGEVFINTPHPSVKIISYDKETDTLTRYVSYIKDDKTGKPPAIQKIQNIKDETFKSIEELEKELKKPQKYPIEFHPSVMLSR